MEREYEYKRKYKWDYRIYLNDKDNQFYVEYIFYGNSKYDENIEVEIRVDVWDLVEELFVRDHLVNTEMHTESHWKIFNHETFKEIMNEYGLWDKALDKYSDDIAKYFAEDAEIEYESKLEELKAEDRPVMSREEYMHSCNVYDSDFH